MVDDKYSSLEEILFGLPQMLHSVTFQYFLWNFLLFTNDIDIASYADDNTPYAASSERDLAIEKLDQCSDSLFTVFQKNGIKANADICHFLVSKKLELLMFLTTISIK